MNIQRYKDLAKFSIGDKKASLVLKNANIISVQTGEIFVADIAIEDKFIVGVGKYDGIEEIDMTGKYISPGFVDSHLHFESTMAKPSELVHYASKSGTTTFIVDPHEAANVSGLDGIRYILDETDGCSADVYIMMPSCVPCVDGEDSGFVIEADDMKKIMNNDRILGLAEVMDCSAVINKKESMMDKLSLFENRVIDGHAIGLSDKELNTYIMAGVMTDHECTTYEDALRKVRNGMYVQIREGSAAKNLEYIVKGIVRDGINTSSFLFCTDDKHVEDIINEGHISYNIKKAITLGIKPIEAYKMASYNAAKCYGLKDIGMISVGKKANLVVLNDMYSVDIDCVYYEGKKIINKIKSDTKHKLMNTVHIDWFNENMLKLKEQEKAILLIDNQLLTKEIDRSEGKGVENKVVSIERHHNTGKYHSISCFNFGIMNGAIATSVSHDSHNVVVIGDNDEDMMIALEELKKQQGGVVLVDDGEVYDCLPLKIMGLMCDDDSDVISEKLRKMKKKAYEMGVNKNIDPFITPSFIALPCIPEIRITTNGVWRF